MEAILRLGAFFGIFASMAGWEFLRPRRREPQTRWRRWPVNLGLGFLNAGLIRITAAGAMYNVAGFAADSNLGLLNRLDIPGWAAVIVSFLVLDFAIYAQHVVFHKVPLFWRLHQVHHTDVRFDATTSVRFHPLEILLSMGYKCAIVLLIGADATTTIVFEIVLNGCAVFNHSNVFIPEAADRVLRWVIITPDMHRIHHSTKRAETDSNYGFSVPWWDKLCRTYRPMPQGGQLGMTIGLTPYRDMDNLGFLRLIAMPFERPKQ